MILAEGWRISALSILDDTASTTEQDDEEGERYKKNMKVVECERAQRKHISDSSSSSRIVSRKIALNIYTKAVHMPSILVMDWQVARQLEIGVLDVVVQVGFAESKDVRVVLD